MYLSSFSIVRGCLSFLLFLSVFWTSEVAWAQKKNKEEALAVDDAYKAKLRNYLETGNFENSFHGLYIYDLDSQKSVFEYNAERYFTPASNAKLFTYYVGVKMLKDSLPNLRYIEKGDSLIFWGTGDPTFLHPVFKNTKALEFLKGSNKKLFFSTSNYSDTRLGDGWAWDDYNTDHSMEKSPLPIYGNMVVFEANESCQIKAYPSVFEEFAAIDETLETRSFMIDRDLDGNSFTYNIGNLSSESSKKIPFRASAEFTARLLADTLGLPISLINFPPPANTKVLSGFPTRKLFRQMMHTSDNFLAEQILLMCSESVFGSMETSSIIDYAQNRYLKDMTQEPRWVDASGLSRYNLFTPRSFVELLIKLRATVGEEELKYVLPEGGKSGTLRNRFERIPGMVFAKTGTFSNNFCLSGYLYTKSGKKLAFSFMNNHYRVPVRVILHEVESILTNFYRSY